MKTFCDRTKVNREKIFIHVQTEGQRIFKKLEMGRDPCDFIYFLKELVKRLKIVNTLHFFQKAVWTEDIFELLDHGNLVW